MILVSQAGWRLRSNRSAACQSKWPPDTLQYETSLRCAHVIVLFEKHGIFEDFITKHWPNGNTEDDERIRRHYLSIKQRYEEATAVGENRSDATGQTATLKDLFDDDWACEVVDALGEPSTWEPWVQEWMRTLSHTLTRVKAADPAYSRAWGRGWRALRLGMEHGESSERLWISPSWEIYERWCFVKIGQMLVDALPGVELAQDSKYLDGTAGRP